MEKHHMLSKKPTTPAHHDSKNHQNSTHQSINHSKTAFHSRSKSMVTPKKKVKLIKPKADLAMIQLIINNVTPFLCSLFAKDGVNYQSIDTFKLAHVNKMSLKTMSYLDTEQIRKYHEVNQFVDVLEETPLWFKNYKIESKGNYLITLRMQLNKYDKAWKKAKGSHLFDQNH